MGRARKFSQEFKDQAVLLAKELGSNAEAGRQLGVCESVIRGWIKKSEGESQVFSREVLPRNQDSEIERLRRENLELKKVNHILRAAAAVFCQDQLK